MLQTGDNRDHGTVAYQYKGGVQADLCGMTLAPGFHLTGTTLLPALSFSEHLTMAF